MTPLLDYILMSQLPEDPSQAQKVRKRATRFVVLNGVLYRQYLQGPMLKCLAGEDAEYVLKEMGGPLSKPLLRPKQ